MEFIYIQHKEIPIEKYLYLYCAYYTVRVKNIRTAKKY